MTDRKRLIGEVAARHGLRLEEDDPAFLLVTLAELTMREAQDEFLAAVRQATNEHEQSAERLQKRMGEALGKAVTEALHSVLGSTVPRPSKFSLALPIWRSLFAGLCLVGIGYLAGGGCQ